MSYFKMSSEQVDATINELKAIAESLDIEFGKLDRTIEELVPIWAGAAMDSYRQIYDDLKASFLNSMVLLLRNYSETIREAKDANTFKDIESSNDIIRSFSSMLTMS